MVRVNVYMVVTTLKEQLLLGITFVEPRPRAPDTIMNYNSEFISGDLGKEKDGFIGQDLLSQDADELRQYFPIIKSSRN